MKSIKNLLLILALSFAIFSCGEGNRSSETNVDSLRNSYVNKDSLDSVNKNNSIHNIEKGAASTIDSANKMVEKADSQLRRKD
ncbi:MAG: hypothetical protein ABI123_10295 [Ginsengibacter sp.]|jgi:uncharacterized lipoprotein YehR (DUF1307 family)